MKNKISIPLLLSITFFATSITLFDFDNPGWVGNEKSYIGFVVGLLILVWSRKK